MNKARSILEVIAIIIAIVAIWIQFQLNSQLYTTVQNGIMWAWNRVLSSSIPLPALIVIIIIITTLIFVFVWLREKRKDRITVTYYA